MIDGDLATYEGTGTATLANGATVQVSFVVRQLANSDLRGLCDLIGGGRAEFDVKHVKGVTTDGWSIVIDCSMYERGPYSWRQVELHPRILLVTSLTAAHTVSAQVSGPLLNFKLPYPHQAWKTQTVWRGHQLDISRVDDYPDRIARLEEGNGILQTATLACAAVPGMSPEDMRNLFTEITTPLSLATGRIVTLANITVSDVHGQPLARFHADAVTHPFRTHADGFGLTTNVQKLLSAWESHPSQHLPLRHLTRRIHQYLDAVVSTLFLDSRAMLAVCFLDAFSTEYCKAYHNTRPSLKERLETMVNDLNIPITTTPDICEVVKDSRHNLVHEGTFVAVGGDVDIVWETIQAHWLAFAFLTRIIDPTVGIRPIYDVRTQAGTTNPLSDYRL